MIDQRWGALGKKVEPAWGPERELSALDEIEHRATRRRTAGRVGASILALAVVAGGVRTFVGLRKNEPTVASSEMASSSAPSAPAAIETVTVTQLSPETILDPMPDRHGRGFVLHAGGARFFVPHDTRHPFTVVAGDVTIEDLGTTFTVRYLSADRVDIAVEEGRVKVSAPGAAGAARSNSELGPGQRLEVALSSPSPSPSLSPSPSSATAAPALEKRPHSTTAASSSWRPLAEKGRYDEAHTALKKAGPNAVRDETADLLLAADAARLSGYPAEALPYLERVVRAHARDPRSSLASFTLGRVLLDELGRPREAADAFARARAAGGPLAEDALAREVEAAARSGDTTRSRELARDYQSLYPHGRRAKAVSRFGGLD